MQILVIPGIDYLIILDIYLWGCRIIYGNLRIICPESFETSPESPSENKKPAEKNGRVIKFRQIFFEPIVHISRSFLLGLKGFSSEE